MAVAPEAKPQQIRAWGPGLEGGVVGKPATFVVESIGADVGVLGESFIRIVLVSPSHPVLLRLFSSDLLCFQVLPLRDLRKLKSSVRTRTTAHVMSVTGRQRPVNMPSM